MSSARVFPTIKAIRSYVISGVGSGGDYHNVKGGHWSVVVSHPWEREKGGDTCVNVADP